METTDGLGSHIVHKHLEVYTSQTRSQIGSKTVAVLSERGKERKYLLTCF